MDSAIRAIIRAVRRDSRQRESGEWQVARATVRGIGVRDAVWNGFRPVVNYSFEVNGESFYGAVAGFEISRDYVDQVAEKVKSLEALWVRYDPADPYRNRVLGADNPSLPFEVDLNEEY